MRRTLLEVGVVMRVRRRAAAQNAELARSVVLELVPRARRDQYGVAGTHVRDLAVDLHLALPLEHEVDLLGDAVVVALGRLLDLERRLGKALHVRVMELANRRAILRHERLDGLDRGDLHQRLFASASATRSCAPLSSAVKNGSASVRELASSDTGQSPSPYPYRSRMYDWRWIDGR